MIDNKCKCKDCKKAKHQGLVLGSQLLRHLGEKAYHVSAYVKYHRYQKGRRPDRTMKEELRDV